MPKKAPSARNRTQRNKPKVPKTFELVRPESDITEAEEGSTPSSGVSTATIAQGESESSTRGSTKIATQGEQEIKASEHQNPPSPGSASARLAARRQTAQKQQQRSATTLITSEHFAYVRKDLIKIAIFAAVMFTAIIALYLVLGRS
jgi:hypothetical protein